MTDIHEHVTDEGEKNAAGVRPAGGQRPAGAGPRKSRAPRPATSGAAPRRVEHQDRLRQRLIVLTVLAAVIVVDQAAKWWAWRHVPGAKINPGGDFLTGPTIGRWYTQPGPGAALDLLDTGLLSIAVAILARRRRQAAVTVCGSLMLGGWASNLLDRLGMHYWTAPGSVRGVVDFIRLGVHRYNVADVAIIGATFLFLLAAASLARRPDSRPAAALPASRGYRRARAPVIAFAGAGLIMTVALGAAHQGRLIRPSHAGVACCQRAHPDRRPAASPHPGSGLSGSGGRERARTPGRSWQVHAPAR